MCSSDIVTKTKLDIQEPTPANTPNTGQPVTTAIVDDESQHTTDLGNACRLVGCHGDDIRYCGRWKKWLVWDDTRWVKDEKGAVVSCAKKAVLAIYLEAAEHPNQATRRELAAHAARSESEQRINAMINLARSEPGIPILPDELDLNPWLLNVQNGTLDLKTQTLRQHERSDLITKIAPVTFDPAATCPQWTDFLARILPNPAVRRFLQRAIGSALTGIARDKVIFVLWGGGDNGKSVFVETIIDLLGDYAKSTPVETFLAKKSGAIPNDVARLQGARFAAAQESDEGRRMNESLVKALTGRDTITARFFYAEFFDFRPQFKPFLSTNHRPMIRGTDNAIWNRLKLVPFTVTIPEAEQDECLPDKLRAELPGILNWALDGCREWQQIGVSEPEAVRKATTKYREEMDLLRDFLDECCEKKPDVKTPIRAVYDAYKRWVDANGEEALSQTAFSRRLQQRGYQRKRSTHGQRVWVGLALKPVTR